MFLMFISLLISFLNAFISPIATAIINLVKRSPESVALKVEIADLTKQLQEISMVDEFVKYTRLDRKLNKLNDQLAKDMRENVIQRLKLTATVNFTLQGAIILASLLIFWTYRWTPIVVLPQEWLGPFSVAMSWPTGQPGAIGFPVWFLACNSFAKFVAKPSL